jgi:hypothetical protein
VRHGGPIRSAPAARCGRETPSILNTRPWSFRIVAGDHIQLCDGPSPDPADPRRRRLHLEVTDPVIDLVQGQGVADLIPGRGKDPVLLATVNIGISRYRATTIMEQDL